jgi:hypothetical protein
MPGQADDRFRCEPRLFMSQRAPLVHSLAPSSPMVSRPPLNLADAGRCAFDTKTDRFSIPADFADNNAKPVNFPEPKRK